MLEVTNDWTYNIDKGSVNAIVFLDLKKAFDTVDHHIFYLNYMNMEYEELLIIGFVLIWIIANKNVS